MALHKVNEGVLLDLGYVPGGNIFPHRVDFNLVFASEDCRMTAKVDVCGLDFGWEDQFEPVEEGTFEAVAFKVVCPTAEAITDCEMALIECIAPFGAYTDGWGFFGDSVH